MSKPTVDPGSTRVNVHDLKALRDAIEPIHGWWQPESGVKLYNLVKASKLDVLELGAWCGRSTAWIAAALEARADGHFVTSVDTWEGTPGEAIHDALISELVAAGYAKDNDPLYELFKENLRSLGLFSRVTAMQFNTVDYGLSIQDDPWPGDYDVLLIDADHTYDAVKHDFETFAPRMPVGSHIIFDDVPTWHGPTKMHREVDRATWKLIEYWPNQAVFRRIK